VALERAAALQRKWKVKRGQVWQIGAHRLMCGDALDKNDVAQLMMGRRAEICFSSPPYNIGGNTVRTPYAQGDVGSPYLEEADDLGEVAYFELLKGFTENALKHVDYCLVNIQSLAANKRAIIDYQAHFRDRFADVAIWHKTNFPPAMAERVMSAAFEFVLIFASKTKPSRAITTGDVFRGTVSNVVMLANNAGNEFAELHGAAFSVEFCQHFVETFSAASVLDLFVGTGTTLVVAEHLGRVGFGMDKEPTYCALTLERMRATFPKLKIGKVRP
jgi:DNA modification methylase